MTLRSKPFPTKKAALHTNLYPGLIYAYYIAYKKGECKVLVADGMIEMDGNQKIL